MPQVDTVLLHGSRVRMLPTGMSVALLQRRVSRTARQPNADHTALTGNSVYSRRLQSQVVLDRSKETRNVPGRVAHMRDVASRRHPADAVEYQPDIRQESD
jgi:hypothetical protein